MIHLPHEKKITWFVVITFIANALTPPIAELIFPSDFSGEYPVYPPDSISLLSYGAALQMAGLTVFGLKLADEKKVLPAAGFTMLAISTGILMASLFEISNIVSLETYEKFYRIQASSNFLILPAMYLVSEHEDFKKWVRYIGLVSVSPLIMASFMFLGGNRNFQLLEEISNSGFVMLAVTSLSWAYNIYFNFRKASQKR